MLLRRTLALIGTLPDGTVWSFGGGTALAVHYAHRISYDIDAFVGSSDIVRALTPQRNGTTKALLDGRTYEYPGNYLKLIFAEGEIDFIAAGRRTDNPVVDWLFEGHQVPLETPWEIATKKMFHRPSNFKVRDIFDTAAVIDHHADELRLALPEVADRAVRLMDRIDLLRPVYEAQVRTDVNPTPAGQRYGTSAAADQVLGFLRSEFATL
ncbi:nucleotidyl transferase AbiEii/AbiGii toxin family protein [Nitrospirillum sp. BR 11163]|uniref:nucleotidyl transferase AbiEii/AbiGii toxin family protein n=1 Tax=Nitrospirillum sp. BR 11163 TaxID=3104323 RepID=UPI002AFE7E17|nr:nucleotidyl transferase AbiEii/AbiGii toxin family protein [Nitrospirillum sp. BR 11163]MEA1673355.1 nucleotidyl transferase AbiEii/AbiGii toxin family protein [Nitrospirillum sp. BR 11163]